MNAGIVLGDDLFNEIIVQLVGPPVGQIVESARGRCVQHQRHLPRRHIRIDQQRGFFPYLVIRQRQVDGQAGAAHAAAQAVHGHHRGGFAGGPGRQRRADGFAAPHQQAHARHQLFGLERLAQEIVRAHLKTLQFAGQLGLAGEKDDRRRAEPRRAAQSLDDFVTVKIGQLDVHNDELGIAAPCRAQAVHAGFGKFHFIPLRLKGMIHHFEKNRLIINQ